MAYERGVPPQPGASTQKGRRTPGPPNTPNAMQISRWGTQSSRTARTKWPVPRRRTSIEQKKRAYKRQETYWNTLRRSASCAVWCSSRMYSWYTCIHVHQNAERPQIPATHGHDPIQHGECALRPVCHMSTSRGGPDNTPPCHGRSWACLQGSVD